MHRSLQTAGSYGLLAMQVLSCCFFYFPSWSWFYCSLSCLHICLHCRIWMLFLLFCVGEERQMAPPGWWKDSGRSEDGYFTCSESCLLSFSPTGLSALHVPSPGLVQSSCHSRIFWMKLNKLLLQGKFFQLEINGESQGAALSTVRGGESPTWSPCMWSVCCCHLCCN